MSRNDEAIAATYASQFAARTDVFAIWTGQHWACVRDELSPARVIAALTGSGPSLSGYTIRPDGMTHVCAIDFDTDDGFDMAKRLRGAMAESAVTAYIEPSRRGGHLWVCLDRELSARTVRRALRAFLRDAHITETPKVELRPAGDRIEPDGVGYPIRLPTMPHPKTGLRYPLIGPDDTPLPPRLDQLLLAIEWSRADAFAAAADTIRPTPADLRPGDKRPYLGPVEEGSASDVLRRLWGAENAAPGRSIKCPAHDDHAPSLSILRDDQRVQCKAPACQLHNNGRGRGVWELTKMAPRGAT